MRVIVYAEDRSGRGNGQYTKQNVSCALDVFFQGIDSYYQDPDGETEITRLEAEETYLQENKVTFYNEDGERIAITKDWSPA